MIVLIKQNSDFTTSPALEVKVVRSTKRMQALLILVCRPSWKGILLCLVFLTNIPNLMNILFEVVWVHTLLR